MTLAFALFASQSAVKVPRELLRDQQATVGAVKNVPVPVSRASKRLTDARADARRPSYRPDAAPPPQIELPARHTILLSLATSSASKPCAARRAHVAESRAPPIAA